MYSNPMEIAATPSIWGVLIMSLPLLIRLAVDYIKIERKNQKITKLGYRLRWGLTLLGTLGAGALSKLIDPTAPYIFHVLFSGGVFLLFFDYALNLLRKKDWYYISANPNHGSWIERWKYNNNTVWSLLFAKLIVTGTMISTYLYYTYL